MKKFLMFTVLIAFSLASFSQIPLIIKAGYGKSDWRGDAVSSTDAQYDWKVGVGTEFYLYERFFLQPMLYFVNEGTVLNAVSTSSTDGTARVIYHQNYLQLPVLLGYRTHISPRVNIVSTIGPYVGYGIYGKKRTSITLSGSTSSSSVNTFDDGNVEKLDAGISAGVGLEFQRMTIGADFQFGMLDLIKNVNARNIAGFLTMGYRFDL